MDESTAGQPDYTELHAYLKQLVDPTQDVLQRHPEFAKVEAYWHIGRIIVETEQLGQERADYGVHLIEDLAQQLTYFYGRGYKTTNLWTFRQFYLTFLIPHTLCGELTNLRQQLREELTWSHYRLIIQLQDKQERAFYLHQAADEAWSVRTLQRLVRSRYYYQVALGEDKLLPNRHEAIREEVVLRANNLSVNQRSRVAKIKKILLTQFVGFAFVGQRQYVSVNGQDEWIELLFYHVMLHRYVLINWGEPIPGTLATMRQLVDAYQHKVNSATSKPSIGLLINNQGMVKLITSSQEIALPSEEAAVFPKQLI